MGQVWGCGGPEKMGAQTVTLAIPSPVSSNHHTSLSHTKPGKGRKGTIADCKRNQENQSSVTPEADYSCLNFSWHTGDSP